MTAPGTPGTPLDPSERERCKYHAGYMGTSIAASINFGIPKPIQTMFLIETAMTNLMLINCNNVRRILRIMDNVEEKLVEAQDRLAAAKVSDITTRENETDLLEHEYYRWGGRLCDVLGVPFYAFSNRYNNQGGVVAGSIPVRGSS
jgi:hypothetical protein